MIILINNSCCFIGHRTINQNEGLEKRLYEIIENLITSEKIDTFLFGSKSQFNDFSHRVVTKAKEKYPHIKRIYVRAEYQYISDNYEKYILKNYEQTYFPDGVIGAGKTAYIKRNYEMIKNSIFCVVYYDVNYNPDNRKSGTKIAFDYAKKLKKNVINIIEK